MKQESGTHRPMGKKGGTSAGLESGVAEVQAIKQSSPDLAKDVRPKAVKLGSIAMK